MFSSSVLLVLHIVYAHRTTDNYSQREFFFKRTECHRLSSQHGVDFLLFFSRSLSKYLLPFNSFQTLKYDSKDRYIDNMSL